jgi:hypothetical protein
VRSGGGSRLLDSMQPRFVHETQPNSPALHSQCVQAELHSYLGATRTTAPPRYTNNSHLTLHEMFFFGVIIVFFNEQHPTLLEQQHPTLVQEAYYTTSRKHTRGIATRFKESKMVQMARRGNTKMWEMLFSTGQLIFITL